MEQIITLMNELDINSDYEYDYIWYEVQNLVKHTFKNRNIDQDNPDINKIFYNYIKYLIKPVFKQYNYKEDLRYCIYKFLDNFNSNTINDNTDSKKFKKIINDMCTLDKYDNDMKLKLYSIFKLEEIELDSDDDAESNTDEEILDNISDITIESSDSYSEYSDTEDEEMEELEDSDESLDYSDDELSDMDEDNKNSHKDKITKDDKAIKEIRHYQKTTNLLINKNNFKKLVDEICFDFSPDIEFDEEASEALQTASEDFLIKLFEDANMQAIHANRSEIRPRDLQMVRKIKGFN